MSRLYQPRLGGRPARHYQTSAILLKKNEPAEEPERSAAPLPCTTAVNPLDCTKAPEWRNGRRGGLKIRWAQAREGSTPFSGTTPICHGGAVLDISIVRTKLYALCTACP